MKNNKTLFSTIFYNDKYLLIFSVILSFIFWIILSSSDNGPETNRTIEDIPIDIQLSQMAIDNNLKVFEVSNTDKANVSLSGNSLALSKITKNDISVTSPQADTITKPGTYHLDLVAKMNSPTSEVKISQASLFPQSVTVLVDKFKENSYSVTDNIKFKTDPQYFSNKAVINPETINILGPLNVMDKIKNVQVDYTVNEVLKSSKKFTAPIAIYDTSDNRLTETDIQKLSISNTEVEVSVEVLKKATLPVVATFVNQPQNWDYEKNVSINIKTLDIAGEEDVINNMTAINLPPIDFADIDIDHNVFEQKVELPFSCKNLSNNYSATVTINTENLASTVLSLNKFAFKNVPDDIEVKALASSIEIEVIGPQDAINNINVENINAIIDFSGKESITGHTELPVTFTFNNLTDCWIFGKHTANVTIKKK